MAQREEATPVNVAVSADDSRSIIQYMNANASVISEEALRNVHHACDLVVAYNLWIANRSVGNASNLLYRLNEYRRLSK